MIRFRVLVLLAVAAVPLLLSAQPYSDLAALNIVVPDTLIPTGPFIPEATVGNLSAVTDTAYVHFWIGRLGGGFLQSFDATAFPPPGWQEVHPDGGSFNWIRGTSFPYSPPGYATCLREASLLENDDWLITPRMNVNAVDTIYFWFRALGPQMESIRVRVSYTDSNPASFIHTIQSFDFNNNTYQLGWADFHEVGDASVFIAFQYKMRAGQSGTGICLDDIQLPDAYYHDVTRLIVPGGEMRTATFLNWDADTGRYVARCSVAAVADSNPVNDQITKPFRVYQPPPPPSHWTQKTPMPLAPSGKPVKRGGWLTLCEANGLVYAAKGYKTTDFYSYDPSGDNWALLSGMPYTTHPVWRKKAPRKGSKGICDGERYIYVTQGNNSLGFWRYDIATDSWLILPDVPLGPSGKKVKGGTDLVYVSGSPDYVYMLKGYRTEFYRYDVSGRAWEQLADAPTGVRNKWDKGSWIVVNGGKTTIWAHKAKYHEMYEYDLAAGTWGSVVPGMPFIGWNGRRKKSKDGGSAAWHSGDIWALKGGNTQQFWHYDVSTGTWTEKDTLPQFGVSGRRKRVKHGGDLVLARPGGGPVMLALKGNKTTELWQYGIDGAFASVPDRAATQAGRTPVTRYGFEVLPNPATGRGVDLRYSLPTSGSVVVEVIDVSGRTVRRLGRAAREYGTLRLDLGGLSSGVYLVRLEAAGYEATRKLVLQ